MPQGSSGRFASLDGLRGLAAVVVLVHHTALATPVLAAAYEHHAGSGWVWWLTNTPLHLLWAGTEAVYVFFVLSGFVLTLPVVAHGSIAWSEYYRRRLVRLYLPVWGALVFALLLWAAFTRSDSTGSWWVNSHDKPPSRLSLIGDFSLMSPSVLDSSLWSLKWEVVFSLLLPLYVTVVVLMRKLGMGAFLIPPVLVTAGGMTQCEALTYLPMFLMGSLLAGTWTSSTRTPPAAGVRLVLGAVTVGLLTQGWWSPWGGSPAATALAVVGAALTVIIFLEFPGAGRLGKHRVAQILGRWSFSLYLVHVPIVITLASAASLPLPALPPLVLLSSLSCAAAFHRLVEAPAHSLARGRGRRAALPEAKVNVGVAHPLTAEATQEGGLNVV